MIKRTKCTYNNKSLLLFIFAASCERGQCPPDRSGAADRQQPRGQEQHPGEGDGGGRGSQQWHRDPTPMTLCPGGATGHPVKHRG